MSILNDSDRVTTGTATTMMNLYYQQGIYSQAIVPIKRERVYREGLKTPNFAKTKARKGLAPLPYFARNIRKEHLSGSFSVLWHPQAIAEHLEYYNIALPSTPFSTVGPIDQNVWNTPEEWGEDFNYDVEWHVLHEKCNAKLLEKVKDMKMDLSVAFGTRQQTVDFVAETATKFARTLLSLKRGDLGGARRALFGGAATSRAAKRFKAQSDKNWYQAMSNQWLEMQYAWTPFLSDIYAGMDLWKTFPRRPTKVVGQEEVVRKKTVFSTGFHGGNINRKVTAEHKLRLRETMFCDLEDNAISSLTTSASQIGLTNPALLAWDVLPFSFVVDWFLPLNGYLSSLDSMLGIQFKHTVVATKYKAVILNEFFGNGLYNAHRSRVEGYASSRSLQKDFRRSISYVAPRPIFPSFKNPISASHAMTSLSLMIALFSNKK